MHNALLFQRPEPGVARGPFRPFPRSLAGGELTLSPKPPWFVTNRTAHLTAKRLTQFEFSPGWQRPPGIFTAALRG